MARARQAGRIALLPVILCLSANGKAEPRSTVGVVYGGGVPAYQEALKPFQQWLEQSGVRVFSVEMAGADAPPNLGAALDRKPDLIVAFGSASTAAVLGLPTPIPVISTMVLPDLSFQRLVEQHKQRMAGVVTLEVPPGQVLMRLVSVFPDRRRIAMVYNPSKTPLDRAGILALAQQAGVALTNVPCADPKALLEAMDSLRGRSDFVWCLPDASLFQPATISPLILASLRNALPIIGFSEGFVRAGALAGFYVDPQDIGRQTAETVLQILDGAKPPAVQPPRSVRFAVNARVLRLLGMELKTPAGNEVIILR